LNVCSPCLSEYFTFAKSLTLRPFRFALKTAAPTPAQASPAPAPAKAAPVPAPAAAPAPPAAVSPRLQTVDPAYFQKQEAKFAGMYLATIGQLRCVARLTSPQFLNRDGSVGVVLSTISPLVESRSRCRLKKRLCSLSLSLSLSLPFLNSTLADRDAGIPRIAASHRRQTRLRCVAMLACHPLVAYVTTSSVIRASCAHDTVARIWQSVGFDPPSAALRQQEVLINTLKQKIATLEERVGQ
jgi:hypothetical protein